MIEVPYEVLLPTMTFRWLHLSDTHFREDELWDRRATLRALITRVAELKDKGLAPDMVFVTGDISKRNGLKGRRTLDHLSLSPLKETRISSH